MPSMPRQSSFIFEEEGLMAASSSAATAPTTRGRFERLEEPLLASLR